MVDVSTIGLPYERPNLCWYTRAQIGWGNSVAIATGAVGLPDSPWSPWSPLDPSDYSPTPFSIFSGVVNAGAANFSYASSGTSLWAYGRRCLEHVATGDLYSTSPNILGGCSTFAVKSGSFSGDPGDITVDNGPTGTNEGRIRYLNFNYAEYGCGDGICSALEDAASCPGDCFCGNGTCDDGENRMSCVVDCALCGDGFCDPGETMANCMPDCCVPQPPIACPE